MFLFIFYYSEHAQSPLHITIQKKQKSAFMHFNYFLSQSCAVLACWIYSLSKKNLKSKQKIQISIDLYTDMGKKPFEVGSSLV
jgi:hypothetical protein